MASPGAVASSRGSYSGRNGMIILEATPQSPGIGEAVLTGKSLPVDIPTNAAPTVVQGWTEIAQQSMNEMDMRMSLSHSRSRQSAFSVSSRGRAVSVSAPDEDTFDASHNQHSQPQRRPRQAGRTGTATAPRVLRSPEAFQSACAHASTAGSGNSRRRSSFTYHGGVIDGRRGESCSSMGAPVNAIFQPDLCWTLGGEASTGDLRPPKYIVDSQGQSVGSGSGASRSARVEDPSPFWNRYDAYSPPTARTSVMSSGGGGGGGLSARAVSRCGSSGGGEANMGVSMGSTSSNRDGVPVSVGDPISPPFACGVLKDARGAREDGEAVEFAMRAMTWSRFGVRGDCGDELEGRHNEDGPDDIGITDPDGAVFELEMDY